MEKVMQQSTRTKIVNNTFTNGKDTTKKPPRKIHMVTDIKKRGNDKNIADAFVGTRRMG